MLGLTILLTAIIMLHEYHISIYSISYFIYLYISYYLWFKNLTAKYYASRFHLGFKEHFPNPRDRQSWTNVGYSHGKMKSCTIYALSQAEIYNSLIDSSCSVINWNLGKPFPVMGCYLSSKERFIWAHSEKGVMLRQLWFGRGTAKRVWKNSKTTD